MRRTWCQIVALACELIAWTLMLALAGPARRREPGKLGLRLLSAAGRIVRGGRRTAAAPSPGIPLAMGRQITTAMQRLHALTPG
jgi:hypothetical protein